MKKIILILLVCMACSEDGPKPDCNKLQREASITKDAWMFAVRERPQMDPALAQWKAAGKEPEWLKRCNELKDNYVKTEIEYNRNCK